jgi:hypothetical protein
MYLFSDQTDVLILTNNGLDYVLAIFSQAHLVHPIT